MASPSATLLLHPVRLRVLQALLGGRRMTTNELQAELTDVPAATLYRHVAALADAEVLTVVDEQRVRGAVERTYAVRLEATEIPPEELATMSVEEHRQAFLAFVAGLLGDFDRYLDRGSRPARRAARSNARTTGGVDLARDGVGYRQAALWLDDAEYAELVEELRRVVQARSDHEPRDGRRRRLVATVLLPG